MGRKMGEGGGGRGVDGWMNRDGLALGRALVRYLVGLLIGRVVFCIRIEEKKRKGRRRRKEGRNKGGGNGL